MKIYALRFIKTKKIVGVEIYSDYTLEGVDNDCIVTNVDYQLSEDITKIWCTSCKDVADRIVAESPSDKILPYTYSSFDFPVNKYRGQLEVVEFQANVKN